MNVRELKQQRIETLDYLIRELKEVRDGINIKIGKAVEERARMADHVKQLTEEGS